MRSRSPFASRSSISLNLPAALVGGSVVFAVLGAVGWALDKSALAAAGLIAATAFAGAFAVFLIVSERRRHESAEDELAAQASFLESLVESIATISSPLDPGEIVERAFGAPAEFSKVETLPDDLVWMLRDGKAIRGQAFQTREEALEAAGLRE